MADAGRVDVCRSATDVPRSADLAETDRHATIIGEIIAEVPDGTGNITTGRFAGVVRQLRQAHTAPASAGSAAVAALWRASAVRLRKTIQLRPQRRLPLSPSLRRDGLGGVGFALPALGALTDERAACLIG